MWLMTRFAIIFYITILWLGSGIVILFVLHAYDLETIKHLLDSVYANRNLRIIAGTIALGVILVSIMLENLIYGRRKMERTIAFDNVSGQVTVSLVALEDLIKSVISQVPEVKDSKPFLTVGKKGIDAQVKLTLRAQANIPELTARLQDLIRRKIEDAIGLEDKVNIRIHVAKMILEDMKSKRSVEIDPQIPFHGYRP